MEQTKKESGSIFINGEKVLIKSPKYAIKKGIGLIPEDRKNDGCFLDMTVEWNICLSELKI